MAVIALSVVGASAAGDIAGYAQTDHGALVHLLELLGHEVVDVGDSGATHFVALDHNARSLDTIRSTVPIDHRLLVVFEPRVVIPANYHRRTRRHYGDVIAMTPAALSRGLPALAWPQRDWRARPPAARSGGAGVTALINANKLSSIPGSLYGLRRRVIQEFSERGLPLVLAGPNWTRRGRDLAVENLKSAAYAALNLERIQLSEWARPLRLGPSITHLGRVDDKEAVLLGAEFAVVIENSATYVSEKLFDAVIAGCVPLYVGPPLAEFGIPSDIAVILPAEPHAFTRAVSDLSPERKAAVLRAGREWLDDDRTYRRWAMPSALKALAEAIDERVRETGSTP